MMFKFFPVVFILYSVLTYVCCAPIQEENSNDNIPDHIHKEGCGHPLDKIKKSISTIADTIKNVTIAAKEVVVNTYKDVKETIVNKYQEHKRKADDTHKYKNTSIEKEVSESTGYPLPDPDSSSQEIVPSFSLYNKKYTSTSTEKVIQGNIDYSLSDSMLPLHPELPYHRDDESVVEHSEFNYPDTGFKSWLELGYSETAKYNVHDGKTITHTGLVNVDEEKNTLIPSTENYGSHLGFNMGFESSPYTGSSHELAVNHDPPSLENQPSHHQVPDAVDIRTRFNDH